MVRANTLSWQSVTILCFGGKFILICSSPSSWRCGYIYSSSANFHIRNQVVSVWIDNFTRGQNISILHQVQVGHANSRCWPTKMHFKLEIHFLFFYLEHSCLSLSHLPTLQTSTSKSHAHFCEVDCDLSLFTQKFVKTWEELSNYSIIISTEAEWKSYRRTDRKTSHLES